MIKLFSQTKLSSLEKKYDKMMKEVYDLSKVDPQASQQKQTEAQEIYKKIIARKAA